MGRLRQRRTPVPAAAEAPKAQENPFDWDISWKNWHGLDFYASGNTGLQGSVAGTPRLDLQEVRLAASIGGRIEVDGAAYSAGGSLTGFDNGFDLRRARITAKGTSLLAVPFSYRVDLGYVPGNFTVTQAYVDMADLPRLGNLRFGQFTPPVGLQLITSSWDIGLMEPAHRCRRWRRRPNRVCKSAAPTSTDGAPGRPAPSRAQAPVASTAAARSDSAMSWVG